MNLKHRILSLLLALSLALTAAGCAGGTAGRPADSATSSPSPAAETDGGTVSGARTQYPLTITTYNYEREQVTYTFEKAPERVYAQNQDNIEILLALGLGERIVGASGLDGEIRPDLAEAFAQIPYRDSMLSKEEMLALQPDFITGWYSTFSDKRLGDVGFWHERGVGTYMALNSACRGPAAENPQTVEEEMQDILTLGQIFDVQDRAQAIVDQLRAELERIRTYLEDKQRLTVAVLEDEGGTYRVYGEDVLGGNVAISGGASLAVGAHGENGNISAEDLIAANPDAIFMVWYDGYTVNDTDYAGQQVVELITKNPAFASLKAVQEGRVYPINLSGIYCSGMRTLDGVLDFAANLYPEIFQ